MVKRKYMPDKVVSIMVMRVRLSAKLVNKIQTEPFQQGPSNLVQVLVMATGQNLLLLKVRDKRSRSHAKLSS